MIGFYIKKLKVTGAGLKDAEITFEKGLNIINGPSNTGKSYIFKCIDYIFGAKDLKKIEESKGYDTVYLEIRTYDEKPITIMRSFDSNEIYVSYSNINEINPSSIIKLKSKHEPNREDNISKFLLKLIGINENKILLKNAHGEKKTLGYRAIVNLSMISETDIISEEKSLIFNGIVVDNPYCKSVFRFLLTNIDDILIEEIEKDEIRKAKIDAKIEYIESDIVKLQDKYTQIEENIDKEKQNELPDLEAYIKQLEEVERIIASKKEELNRLHEEQDLLILRQNKSAMLIDRLYLLNDQYKSDIQRLTFIRDGNDLLDQIRLSHCPLCDNIVTNDIDDTQVETVITACEIEKQKISIHLLELENTLKPNVDELNEIKRLINSCTNKINHSKIELNRLYNEKLLPLKNLIDKSKNIEKLEDKKTDLSIQIDDKKRERVAFIESKSQKGEHPKHSINIPSDIINGFCDEIKNTLVKFGYVQVKNVFFDEAAQDIVINGIARKSNGKGFRAFFYTAFAVSFSKYMASKEVSNFSQPIILDSPITTLKEEDIKMGHVLEGDIIDSSLQDNMFTYLAKTSKNTQIIIFENKEVRKEITENCNHIEFTKNKEHGRYGFFPI